LQNGRRREGSFGQGRRSEYQGQTYYFCSIECKKKFEQQKERYAGQQAAKR
jgi:YHS domain-containing protein